MELKRRGPLLIGAAGILPILIFAAVLIAFSARERRRQVQEQAVVEASMLMVEADALLSRTLGSLDALATLPALAEGDTARAYAHARDIAALDPGWVTVTLADPDRVVELFDLRRPLSSPRRRTGTGGLPAGLPGKAFAGGMGGTGERCPCVLAHRLIRDGGGRKYLLTAMVDPAPFQQLIQAPAGPYKVLALVDREGDFIGRSLDYRRKRGKPGSVSLRTIVASGRANGIYAGTTLEGFVSYTAFARSRLSGWSVHIAFEPTILDVPRRRMVAAAALAGAAALALACFLIWFTLRQLGEGRRVEQRLQETHKLEALGQLTGGIAHDFNNLLTPILGGLDLVARMDRLDDRSRRLVEGALQSARKAAKLTGQLLAFSRRQRLEIGPVDLKALLGGLEPLLLQSVGPETRIRIDIADEARCVLSDSNQLELALLNLVVNARDAMTDGGTIRIVATRRPGAEDGEVELIVADTGAGMAPEVLRRATEPFFTTKPPGSGTGLGLAQVHGIVEQSGGSLAIDSEVGGGTTVTLVLPGCALAPGAEPVRSAASDVESSANLRALVCDDDDAVRSFVARTLEDGGFAVEAVADGRTAIAAMCNSGPDLLVLDFAMPGLNGAEVARQARELRPPPALLMITGYAETELLEAIGEDIPILRKPFEADALLDAVRRVLAETRTTEA